MLLCRTWVVGPHSSLLQGGCTCGQRQPAELSRSTFPATTGAAGGGTALGGLAPQSEAAKGQPRRGGVLQFGPFNDPPGPDSHRHNQLHTSNPPAAMYTGLTDIDQ